MKLYKNIFALDSSENDYFQHDWINDNDRQTRREDEELFKKQQERQEHLKEVKRIGEGFLAAILAEPEEVEQQWRKIFLDFCEQHNYSPEQLLHDVTKFTDKKSLKTFKGRNLKGYIW